MKKDQRVICTGVLFFAFTASAENNIFQASAIESHPPPVGIHVRNATLAFSVIDVSFTGAAAAVHA